MLDDFHYRRRVESGQALVAVDQRAVQELDALPLAFGQAVQMQAIGGDFQRAM